MKKKSETITARYASTAALVAALANEPVQDAWKGRTWIEENSRERQKSWQGEYVEVADRKLSQGDADLARRIKAQGDIIKSAQGGKQPRIVVSVVGCVPSVPNYLRGVPANMMRVVREPRQQPVINIYVEASIYDGINIDTVAQKAAIIANAIAATELAGVRVNLYAVTSTETGGNKYGCIVKLKDAQSPLNLLNIAFPLCNRAYVRSVFLRWIERHVEKYDPRYGRPLKGQESKDAFKLQGVVLSIRDLVDYGRGLDYVEREINEYLKAGTR